MPVVGTVMLVIVCSGRLRARSTGRLAGHSGLDRECGVSWRHWLDFGGGGHTGTVLDNAALVERTLEQSEECRDRCVRAMPWWLGSPLDNIAGRASARSLYRPSHAQMFDTLVESCILRLLTLVRSNRMFLTQSRLVCMTPQRTPI